VTLVHQRIQQLGLLGTPGEVNLPNDRHDTAVTNDVPQPVDDETNGWPIAKANKNADKGI
jgi:hypothetical protein